MPEINNFIELRAPKALDARYLKNGVAPYTSTADANSAVISAFRCIGLQALIQVDGVNKWYHYKNGVADSDLIPMIDKVEIGLGNADNTSDVNKPVSTLQQTALDLKETTTNKSTSTTLGNSDSLYPTQNAVKTYVDANTTLTTFSNTGFII